MSFAIERPNRNLKDPGPVVLEPEQAEVVLAELELILTSRSFKNAVRSRQVLEFVVRHAIEGNSEQLKERTIGTEVFHRAPGYATGDDPVVRVQAGEVRRRLEQYYQETHHASPLRIELPVGSYAPHIRWVSAERTAVEEKDEPEAPRIAENPPVATRRSSPKWIIVALCLCVILALGAGFLFENSRGKLQQRSLVEQFWAPAFATPQPVLICLAKPVVYRPSFELYKRYARSHPGTFETEVERSNQALPLRGNEKVEWSQMLQYPDYGVALGDAYSAVSISGLLGELGKPSQVRIGTNYSFEDLRNSPDVIIGAFNNKWTMQMMPTLHFAFVEENGEFTIRERIANGRVWRSNLRDAEKFGEDYALVARLLDSKTGQFTVIAAGLTSSGTQAAGEFVSNPDFLEKGLRGAPGEWQKKNLELVLETTVTDSTPGPPQLIGAYAW
jgi:hypothetical protein